MSAMLTTVIKNTYWHRRTEVRAMQWRGDNLEAIEDFVGLGRFAAYDQKRQRLYIFSVEGAQRVNLLDWFVFDDHRDLHVVGDARFQHDYEEAFRVTGMTPDTETIHIPV